MSANFESQDDFQSQLNHSHSKHQSQINTICLGRSLTCTTMHGAEAGVEGQADSFLPALVLQPAREPTVALVLGAHLGRRVVVRQFMLAFELRVSK